MPRGKEVTDSDRGRERMKECRKERKERRQGGRKTTEEREGWVVGGERWGGKGRSDTLPVNGTATSIFGKTSKWCKYPREGHRQNSKPFWLSFACVIRIILTKS